MGSLAGLKEGDPLVIVSSDPRERAEHRTVAKTGRVWVTDNRGSRFRIANGAIDNYVGYHVRAVTEDEYEVIAENARQTAVLKRWGLWNPLHTTGQKRELTREQQGEIVALLESWEG